MSPFLALILMVVNVAKEGSVEPAGSTLSDAPENAPVFHIQNRSDEPLLQPEKPWEGHCINGCTVIRVGERWRMWYAAYDLDHKRDDDGYLCYAESADGNHWTRPDLGIVEYKGSKSNNIIISGPQMGGYAFSAVFLDEGKDVNEEYKMVWHRFISQEPAWWVYGGISSDGIHWSLLPEPIFRMNSDTTTPCIVDGGKYRLYVRVWSGGTFSGARTVGYTESDHFGNFPEPVEILHHDEQDPEGMQFYTSAATKLRDDLYVMFPAAFYTKEQTVRSHLAWSRDGVHFTRYGREPVVDLGTAFGTMGIYVMPGAIPGELPNTWWFYYSATDIEHDADPVGVKAGGGIGRFLLVME